MGTHSHLLALADEHAAVVRSYRHLRIECEGYRRAYHATLSLLHTERATTARLRERLRQQAADRRREFQHARVAA
jgi:hypothetical protein